MICSFLLVKNLKRSFRQSLLLCLFLYFFGQSFANTTSLSSEYEQFIEVVTYNDKDERLIPGVKSDLSKEIVQFQFDMKSFQDINITIHIAPNRKTYEEWVKNKAVVFQNSVGFTDLSDNQIYIKNPSEISSYRQMISLLLHEYIHIFIYYHWTDAPLWFHEGMAGYFAENISLNRMFSFMTNNAFHNKFLLAQYAYTYPENKTNLEPFYFQSALLIKRAYEEDKKRFENLFELGDMNQKFATSFQIAFHTTTEEFLANFNKYLTYFFKVSIYKGILLLSWLFFPALLIIAKIRKDKQTKQILDEWEKEDLIEELKENEGVNS